MDEAAEGQVLQALKVWRGFLGDKLAQHRRMHRAEQEAFDNWLRLPADLRAETPKPKLPSLGTEVTDKNGYVWVVDDRFLILMDDLQVRLQKWQESGPEHERRPE